MLAFQVGKPAQVLLEILETTEEATLDLTEDEDGTEDGAAEEELLDGLP